MNETCYTCEYYDEWLTDDNEELPLCRCNCESERPENCPENEDETTD